MTSVLIVDDNPRDRERLGTFLDGFGPLFASEGSDALSAIEESPEAFDAVIVLWELHGPTSGPEVLTQLHRAHPTIPVIVTSGLLDLSRAAKARAMGAVDFLLKPLERQRVRGAIERVLAEKPASALLGMLRKSIIGESEALREPLASLAAVIPRSQETVLLTGENGTGKELMARAIHDLDPRRSSNTWLAINMAGIPSDLIESTLFGHEKGAFTSANERRIGAFEECGDGTLFLDEIGELDWSLQAKLLRVVQERTFRRVGGTQDLAVSARLVFATNRDLLQDISDNRFREDLYYRIAGNEIHVPPLRERKGDLKVLVDYFINDSGHGQTPMSRETWSLLSGYSFPGNVRELQNVVSHCLRESDGGRILPYHLPVEIMLQRQDGSTSTADDNGLAWPERLMTLPQKEAVRELEREFNRVYLPRKLKEAGGNITRASKDMNLDTKTFRRKWDDAGLPPFGQAD